MANPIKQLAGETAIYGLSTILARILNFLFVPVYTRVLTTASYGVVAEFMGYIAVFQVVLVLGLETGCFRFANKEGADSSKVYSSALAAVFAISMAFIAVLVAFAGPIATGMGYAGNGATVKYVGGILALDAVTAILFAKLRQEHSALKFAVFKTIKILTETVANLWLFFGTKPQFIYSFIGTSPSFDYPIFATFVSCVVCALLFIPTLLRFNFSFDRSLLKQMLVYSLPLMVASLPGVINDFLDRLLFRYFDTSASVWQSSLGVYQAAVKLAVIMNLFIQMFRYAAEPFFFQRAADRNSKQLYAKVMEYFTAFCGLVFVGTTLFMDIIGLILGKDFRSGLGVVPVMLVSYMLLGMLFNVSMWYKLSGKTSMAIWITSAGLLVTVVVNVLFMPLYSFWASAFGHFASYLVMLALSAWLGSKYNPFPYRWGRISLFFVAMAAVYVLMLLIDLFLFPDCGIENGFTAILALKWIAHLGLALLYLVSAWFILGRPLNFKS